MYFFVLLIFGLILLIPHLFRNEGFENYNLDKFYKYIKENPEGEQLVLDKSKRRPDNEITNLNNKCQNIKSCQELKNPSNDMGCGYCGDTNKFAMGNIDEPFIQKCPSGWSWDAASCQKNKEKNICEKVNSCMTLPAQGCGWCDGGETPVNRAFPSKLIDGKVQVKYSDDICPTQLLSKMQCSGENLKNDECMKNYESGPHTEVCLRKLWNEVGCSLKWVTEGGKFPEEWKTMRIPKLRILMENQKLDADAGSNSDYFYKCYGEQDPQKITHQHGENSKPNIVTHSHPKSVEEQEAIAEQAAFAKSTTAQIDKYNKEMKTAQKEALKKKEEAKKKGEEMMKNLDPKIKKILDGAQS